MVALLAILVSAPLFPLLFRRACIPDDPLHAKLAGRQTDRLRLLADWSSSLHLVGAVCNNSSERVYAIGLFVVLHVFADLGWSSVCEARMVGLLVGDDLLDDGLHDRLFCRDVFSGGKPVVCDGRVLARSAGRRAYYRNCESHRALWPCARRGFSLRACDGRHRCTLGRMEIPAQNVLDITASVSAHVREHSGGPISLRGGRSRWDSHGNAGFFDRWLGDEVARGREGRAGSWNALEYNRKFRIVRSRPFLLISEKPL